MQKLTVELDITDRASTALDSICHESGDGRGTVVSELVERLSDAVVRGQGHWSYEFAERFLRDSLGVSISDCNCEFHQRGGK